MGADCSNLIALTKLISREISERCGPPSAYKFTDRVAVPDTAPYTAVLSHSPVLNVVLVVDLEGKSYSFSHLDKSAGYVSFGAALAEKVVDITYMYEIERLKPVDTHLNSNSLEQLKCSNCGGSINRGNMVCEYCGTEFTYRKDQR